MVVTSSQFLGFFYRQMDVENPARKIQQRLIASKPILRLAYSAPKTAALTLPAPSSRIWELDCGRGIAVIAMIAFHLAFDLNHFHSSLVGGALPFSHWFWLAVPQSIGSLFLSIVGASAWISSRQNGNEITSFMRQRAYKILGLALAVNLVTLLVTPQTPIYFGILHCIGISLLLLPPFLHLYKINFIFGTALIFAGAVLQQFRFEFPWLLWLGFTPRQNAGWDHYPLLPWFGVVLQGIFWARFLHNWSPLPALRQRLSSVTAIRSISFLGRHSLLIYFLHQPILLALLYLLNAFHS